MLPEERMIELEGKAEKYSKTSTEAEKTATKAERDAEDIKKAEFMESKIGEEYFGIVSSITSFGMFVELESTIEGLIRFENMGNEYFIGEAGQEIPGIYQDYAMDGSPVVKYLGRNKYLQNSMGERRVSGADSAKVVLARSFGKGNILYNGDAVLEIQVDAEEFADAIRRLSIGKNGTGFRISILNTEGEEIFSETDWDGKVFLEANGWEAGRFRKDGSYKLFDYEYPL